MAEPSVIDRSEPSYDGVNRVAARLASFLLAAAGSCALTLSAYSDVVRATHLGPFLLVLLALHLLWRSRFIWPREFALYAGFVVYMFVALLWTRDVGLSANTLVPAIDCVVVMVLFGSLIRFHNVPSVLGGALFGFAIGAGLYTLTSGFPFSYPQEFSYNAIANMYLFGLFLTLLYGCFRRSNVFLIVMAIVIMLNIVATTSIKSSLGIVLGLIAAGIMYFRIFGRLLRRRALTLIVLACSLGLIIASNHSFVESLDRGVQRVLLGVAVLQARENLPGYSAFTERAQWQKEGVAGWKLNPVFGYGTEAFRADYGITSHSTPVDLLYNSGMIGLMLFYGVFASLIWRLFHIESRQLRNQRPLILAGIVCYVFVSLSGAMHYNVFLAAFAGISAALLSRHDRATELTSPRGGLRGERS